MFKTNDIWFREASKKASKKDGVLSQTDESQANMVRFMEIVSNTNAIIMRASSPEEMLLSKCVVTQISIANSMVAFCFPLLEAGEMREQRKKM